MRIKINKSEIKRIGQKLCENADEIRTQKRNIDSVFNDLASAWEGTDYEACHEIIEENFLPGLEKTCVAIDGLGNYLRKVPATYDSVDNVFKSKRITK